MPDAAEYLTVEFTCARCELTRKKVEVRFRRPDEDIREWMEYVGGVVSRCHAAARPKCRAKVMKELRIPHKEGQLLGTRPGAPAAPLTDKSRTPPCACPLCGHAHDAAWTMSGNPPKPGDVSLCVQCAAINVFAEDLTVRAPTPEELEAIQRSAAWPTVERAVGIIRERKGT